MNGYLVGSSANIYWTGAPECGQNQSITATVELGSSRSKNVSFKVVNQNNKTIWQGDTELQGKTCLKLQLN